MKDQTKGLIIKETHIGENDKLLVILTEKYGIIRAFADGARKLKSRNAASTSLLCYANFTLYKSRDTYKVTESIPIEMFFELRYNLNGLSLAQYLCEIMLRLIPEENEKNEYLRLILNSLHFLTNGKKSELLIKAVTELKAISLAGFMPDLSACSACGDYEKNSPYYFLMDEGILVCEKCKKNYAPGILVNNTVLAAMRHIIYSDFDRIYSFEIPDGDLKTLSNITEKYVENKSEYHFKTLSFYKKISIDPAADQ